MPTGIYERSEKTKERMRQSFLKRKERDGYINSPETREKLRQANLGKKATPEAIKNQTIAQNRPEVKEKKRLKNLGQKRTPEQKDNIRKAKLGKKQSPEHIEKCRQAKIGSKRSPETKEKLRLSKLGKKQSPEHIENNRIAHLGYKQTPETIEKRIKANTGKKRSPEQIENLRHGNLHIFSALDKLVKNKYCPLFSKKLKEEVRLRDNFTCQNCGIIQEEHKLKSGKILTPHHIHYDKSNCYPDLITLCTNCNLKANYNRNKWEVYYMNKLNERCLLFWTKNRNMENKP